MKNLGSLYFILLLLLSALPCSDLPKASNLTANHTLSISAEQEDCSAESCTASCMCACCGQSVIEANLLSLHIKVPSVVRSTLPTYYYFTLAQRDRNIWQPPKLA